MGRDVCSEDFVGLVILCSVARFPVVCTRDTIQLRKGKMQTQSICVLRFEVTS
jgi:hypothetical protein